MIVKKIGESQVKIEAMVEKMSRRRQNVTPILN